MGGPDGDDRNSDPAVATVAYPAAATLGDTEATVAAKRIAPPPPAVLSAESSPSLLSAGSSVPHTGGTTMIGSPKEALERDELLRTRRFCGIALALVLAGGASVFALPGDPVATKILLAAAVAAIGAIAFLFARTGDPARYRLPSTSLGFFIPAVAVTAAIPYFGAFSPACTLLVLGVYFTGLGENGRLAVAVYAVCAAAQGLIGVLVITRVTRDTGLVRPAELSASTQWIVQGLVQIVLCGTFVTARVSRRTALVALGELERAVRQAAHREALLFEAREELERALRAGRGRFTGQVIGGYELGDVIGRGAMGEVYAAMDPRSGASVAIKLLSQASLSNAQHVQRFLRELRTAAGVRSPNVVEVIAIGDHPVPYLVMERLEGHTLSEILRGKRALSLEKVVDLVRQVGIGITAAAATGVIHRDLKPQNVFLSRGTWKILDFGVSRLHDHGDTLTQGQVVGTPSYMAPEQARGAEVDHRTDLYALAAVAYRALTGYPPFAAGDIAETLYRVVHTAPQRPSDLAKLPGDVDAVLAIGLAKAPSARFATAAELGDALAAATRSALPDDLRAHGEGLGSRGGWVRPTTKLGRG